MKRKFTSILLTLILAFTTCVCLTGCNPPDDSGVTVDSSKTQLYVGTYNGGWGMEWLEIMADEFEEMYKDYSFENGKMGIQVIPSGKKSEYTSDNLASSIASDVIDVYFSTWDMSQFATGGKLMDVTNLVKNTVDFVNSKEEYKKVWMDDSDPDNVKMETKNIVDKMDPLMKDYMLDADPSGNREKFYGIPMYTSFYNINYDVDLFYNKGFFKDATGNWIDGIGFTNLRNAENGYDTARSLEVDGLKHAGMDGISGTWDDGLPRNFEEFEELCDYIVSQGCLPITWTGKYGQYRQDMLTNVWACYEGAQNFMLNITSNGPVDTTVGTKLYDLKGNPVSEINYDNGYLLGQQEGRLQACRLAELVVRNDYYNHADCFSGTDHLGAQTNYLKSITGAKPIAMLSEGGWWENEAKATVDSMAAINGGWYTNRRFGVLPYFAMCSVDEYENSVEFEVDGDGKGTGVHKVATPATRAANVDGTSTMYSVTPHANVGIRSNPTQEEASKLFFVFSTSDHCMRLYTKTCGSTRAYDYELTEADLSEMSYYKQSLWRSFKTARDTRSLVYCAAAGAFSRINGDTVRDSMGLAFPFEVNGKSSGAGDPYTAFNNTATLTADAWFNAVKATWLAGDSFWNQFNPNQR